MAEDAQAQASTAELLERVRAYYAHDAVRLRMAEFLGGPPLDKASAMFITAAGVENGEDAPRPVWDLWPCLDAGKDIARSLWDRRVLVAHLDVDYVNFEFPGEVHVHPHRSLEMQRPVVEAGRAVLAEHGIHPLHTLSGGGQHLVWSIPYHSMAFALLAELGRCPPSLAARYAVSHPPHGLPVLPRLGRAFAGLGMVMEYLAHRIIERSAGECPIPVEATAVRVGPGLRGSELIALDVSEYADPLYMRKTRVPFSVYLKAHRHESELGSHVIAAMPPVFLLPLDGMDAHEGIETMHDPHRAADWARRCTAHIPEHPEGMESLLTSYARSDLAEFHAWFYSQAHEPPERWPMTYDRTPLAHLPFCVRDPLEHPNDLLMQPGRIRHVVRGLLSEGWHPRHVAGLIRSKYERDYGWYDYWLEHDATGRADVYTRLFAGLFFTGRDDLVDFNCCSTQEKGWCRPAQCSHNLHHCRRRLLERRTAHV